jgi:N4-(beta-N-acetylglucosaminyl)-L-asparaginase
MIMKKWHRRQFLRKTVFGSVLAGLGLLNWQCQEQPTISEEPVFLATWRDGVPACARSFQVLREGGSVLDAVEAGVMLAEADPQNATVGYGGLPDREGKVTLDACIMEGSGNCGAVCFLEGIKHPISVARRVMEATPHVLLSGEGALQFAKEQGFEPEDLLTEASKTAYSNWLKTEQYQPIINVENHDTIGLIGIDGKGGMAGACTTSGLAYKMRGRVGDSPIAGAGLYVDAAVGAATATGLGEAVLKSLSTFLIVELMRQGVSPQQACEEAIRRVVDKQSDYESFQIGLIALSKSGDWGAYSIHPGFQVAVQQGDLNTLHDVLSFI